MGSNEISTTEQLSASSLSQAKKSLSGSRQSVFTVPGNVKYQTLDMRLKQSYDGGSSAGGGFGDSEQISRVFDTRSAAVRVLSGIDKERNSNTNQYDEELCCVLVGDYGIGKSTLIDTFVNGSKPAAYYRHRFKLQPPRNARIDMFQYKVVAEGERRYCLTLTEAPADTHHIEMERVRSLHYSKADVFLLCFSVVWRPSFSLLIDKLLPEVQAYAPTKPKLLIGLRADLRDSKEISRQLATLSKSASSTLNRLVAGQALLPDGSADRRNSSNSLSSQSNVIVSAAEALAVVRDYGLNGYCECSSVTEVGLRDVFRKIIYVHNNTEIMQTIKSKSTSSTKESLATTTTVEQQQQPDSAAAKSHNNNKRCIIS